MVPSRSDRDQFLRPLLQQQLEETLLVRIVKVVGGDAGEQPELILLVAGGAVSVGGFNLGYLAVVWRQHVCELFQLRSEFGKASPTVLQIDEEWHAAIEVRSVVGSVHHRLEAPTSLLLGECGALGQGNRELLDIVEAHALPLRVGEAREALSLFGSEVSVDGGSHFFEYSRHAIACSRDAGVRDSF